MFKAGSTSCASKLKIAITIKSSMRVKAETSCEFRDASFEFLFISSSPRSQALLGNALYWRLRLFPALDSPLSKLRALTLPACLGPALRYASRLNIPSSHLRSPLLIDPSPLRLLHPLQRFALLLHIFLLLILRVFIRQPLLPHPPVFNQLRPKTHGDQQH